MVTRKRAAMAAIGLAAIAYAAASTRRIEGKGRVLVADSPLLPLPARVIEPGWRFVPWGICRVSSYPASSVTMSVDLSGDQSARSREGARVEVESVMAYSVPADRVLDLHAARGPSYEREWLAALLRQETIQRLGAVSYDVVRNRDPELAGGVLGAMREKAEPAGIRVETLRVVQVAGVGESSGAIRRVTSKPVERELVIVGMDSFDWRIAGPLMEQDRMPHLSRLVARGARANLRTIRPILSPLIWTSVATGVKPSRHGIADFVVTARDTGALVPVTSSMRRVPALWTLLSRQGVDVTVVGWWATWPAETVRGSVVTDRVAFQLFERSLGEDWKSLDPERSRGKTYPPDLFPRILPLVRAPAEVTPEDLGWFLPGGVAPRQPTPGQRELLDRFRTVIAAGQTYHAVALNLFSDDDTSLKMIYYEGPDTASHLFMKHRPPLMAGVDRRDADLLGGIVDRSYEWHDRLLGEILERVGDDATVILVSDHGFKSGEDRPRDSDPGIEKGNAADWHTPVGMLVMAGPDIRPGADLGAASVLDIASTALALYGLPVPRDGDGQPLVEAIEPAFLAEHPVVWIDSYGGFRPSGEAGPSASAGDSEMIEKLRSLGYIGDDRLTAHINRGIMALEEGDVDAAVSDFERAVADGGAGARMARGNLARALMAKGDLDRARSEAERALKEDPTSKQSEATLAGILIKQGDLDGAERHLRRALALDGSFVLARSKLGEVLERRGEHDAALEQFRRVVEIAPLSPIEYNHIGNILRRRGDLDGAMEAYREALRCDAQFIGAYNNLGLGLQERGRLDEAQALYEQALSIRPENPILRNSLGTLLAARGNRADAIGQFERAVKADPGWPVAQGNLATLLLEERRLPEAVAAFERWTQIEPQSVEAGLGLALALLTAGRRGDAIGQLERVLASDPDNVRAHIALGETMLREGRLDGARMHLETAAKLAGDVPRIYNSLGEVYLRSGLRREAVAALQRSLSLQPGQQEVRRRLSEIEAAGS